VKGQLAGLTMTIRNPNNGFAQRVWAHSVQWLNGNIARYSVEPDVARMWRRIRQESLQENLQENLTADQAEPAEMPATPPAPPAAADAAAAGA
jgi:hypothetical protein